LQAVGAYARCRNPLYVGNLLLWTGVAVLQGGAWPFVVPLLVGGYYHLIVLWEEARLAAVHGGAYEAYRAAVPRWLPLGRARPADWSARRALRTERGTLLVLAAVLLALGATP
jgi:protein-S-isoprenylcysteine O-methyltransferase Ste14